MAIKNEIIFFYIEHSENDFIHQQGFNLSSNYHFRVSSENYKYVIRENAVPICQKLPEYFWGKATNISAVVGENGTGKTTLLSEFDHLVGYTPIKKNKIVNTDPQKSDQKKERIYEYWENQKYEKYMRLVIIKTENSLICYHNLPNLKNECLSKVIFREYKQGSDYRQMDLQNFEGPYSFTCITYSNSVFAYTGTGNKNTTAVRNANIINNESISEHGDYLESVGLNVGEMNILSEEFYRLKLNKMEDNEASEWFHESSLRYLNAQTFQQLVDIYYLKKWHDKELTQLLKWFRPSIQIDVVFFDRFVNSIFVKSDDVISQCIRVFNDLNKTIILDISILKNNGVVQLYDNLLFEYVVRHYNDLESIEKPVPFKNIKEIKRFLSYVDDDYIIESLKEVETLESILESDGTIYNDNGLPYEDAAYTSSYIIEDGTDEYQRFLDFITSIIHKKSSSFIIRYLRISGLTFSSGERVLLNFFTWISLLNDRFIFFHMSDRRLLNNILLLMDEADLYLHPEWQKGLLNELVNSFDQLFPDKYVQIIFSTHSPIMLSDIPKGNIIYLKRSGNNKMIVDDLDKHKSTFGASIYILYNDAFFLGETGQIGDFARNKIQRLINILKESKEEFDEDTYHECEQIINVIGDSLIREPLLRMLYEHSKSYKESQGKSLVEQEIQFHQARLKRLLGEDNDTNKV